MAASVTTSPILCSSSLLSSSATSDPGKTNDGTGVVVDDAEEAKIAAAAWEVVTSAILRPETAPLFTNRILGFPLLERGITRERDSHCLHLAIPCKSGGVVGQVTRLDVHLEVGRVVAESRNQSGREATCAAAAGNGPQRLQQPLSHPLQPVSWQKMRRNWENLQFSSPLFEKVILRCLEGELHEEKNGSQASLVANFFHPVAAFGSIWSRHTSRQLP